MGAFVTAEGQMVLIQSRPMAGHTEDSRGPGWLSCLDRREVATVAILVLILAGLMTMAGSTLASPDKAEAS